MTPTETTPATLAELSATVEATDPEASPLRRVVLDVELIDGTRYAVRVINPDFVRYELTRAREGWPSAQDAPMVANTFLAFAASRREGRREGLGGATGAAVTFEAWSAGVAYVGDAPTSGAAVDPSRPAHAAG